MTHHSEDMSRLSDQELHARITATRDEVARDVQALSGKLSSENLKHEASDAISSMARDAKDRARQSVQRTSRAIGTELRTNPVPYAMLAAGAGWLLVEKLRGPADRSLADSELGQQARDRAHEAMEQARNLRDQGAREVERMTRRTQGLYDDNPLGFGLAALAAGAAMGILLPATRREVEWMGATSARVMDEARERAQHKLDQAREVGREVAEDASRDAQLKARQRGLLPEQSRAATESDTISR